MLLPLVLLHSSGFSHADLKKISEMGGDFSLLVEQLTRGKALSLPWISLERSTKIQEKFAQINQQKLQEIIERDSIRIITQGDPGYPEKLRTIKQSPFFLYVRGDLREEKKMLGIVGSRRNTHYGQKVLEHIMGDLIHMGCGIVSGGAYGIDTLSHEITLEHKGYTIAVFGCGVDIAYPARNTHLFKRIIEAGGALVSSFPIGTIAEPWMFPVRNEIVAALSDGIIIPEAGEKSGTLITAKLALEHGRDVFAIPGDVFRETSHGTNMLIARGEAKCVVDSTGILEEYFPQIHTISQIPLEAKKFNSLEEEKIYTAISMGTSSIDLMTEQTQYSIGTIITTLSLLEMSGHIRLGSSGVYEIS